MLQSSVDLMLLQHLIHFGVKRMTRRLGNLVGAHPQTFLLRLTLTHRHAFMTSKTFWRSHGLDFYHGLLGWTSSGTGSQITEHRSLGFNVEYGPVEQPRVKAASS